MAIRRSSGVVKDEKVLYCFASLSYHATSVQHDAYKDQDHSDGNKNLKHCYPLATELFCQKIDRLEIVSFLCKFLQHAVR